MSKGRRKRFYNNYYTLHGMAGGLGAFWSYEDSKERNLELHLYCKGRDSPGLVP